MECNQLVPNVPIQTVDGRTVSLWDWRQKSHVVVILDPNSPLSAFDGWQKEIDAAQEKWRWLRVEFVLSNQAHSDMRPAVFLLDRYGHLIVAMDVHGWTFDAIEHEYTYYEACNC